MKPSEPSLPDQRSLSASLVDSDSSRKNRKRFVKASSWPRFYRILAMFYSSGLSIDRALWQMYVHEQKSQELKQGDEDLGLIKAVRLMSRALRAGQPLPEAFRSSIPNFPVFHYELLELGCESGNLDTVLKYLAEYEENRQALGFKVKAALAYPAIQVGVSLLVLSLLPAYFEKPLIETLASLNRAMPLSLKLLCSVSSFLNALALFCLIMGLFFLLPPIRERLYAFAAKDSNLLRFSRLRSRLMRWGYNVPGVRESLRISAQERFTLALAIQLESGRHLLPALHAAFRVTNDPVFIEAGDSVEARLREGEDGLEAALRDTGLFDEVSVLGFVNVGETTGKLAGLLRHSAAWQADGIGYSLESALSLLEPILLAVVGAFMAGLMLTLFLPLMQVAQSL